MIRRRSLLAALAGITGLATVGAWRFLHSSDQSTIERVLAKRLGYLQLDPGGVSRFSADLASRREISSAKLRLVTAAGPLYDRVSFAAHNFLFDSIRHGEERITSLFLLSSDFFISGADETRTVNYLALYDPLRACSNPFARRAQA
jgi:hypothetical protein